jgi:hypothetical protein
MVWPEAGDLMGAELAFHAIDCVECPYGVTTVRPHEFVNPMTCLGAPAWGGHGMATTITLKELLEPSSSSHRV